MRKLHFEFENFTPYFKTPLRIRKHHFQFENITPNSKTSLRIWKRHSEFQNSTPNLKTSLQIAILHSKFENFTPNPKSKTQRPRVVVFNRVGGGFFRVMEIERTSLIEREQERKTSLKTRVPTSSCMPWINALGVYMKKYTMHSKLIDEIYPVKKYGKQRIPALVR